MDIDIEIIINGEVITDDAEVSAQQSVVIKHSNEVLHYGALSLSQLLFSHLFHEVIAERSGISIYHLFLFG